MQLKKHIPNILTGIRFLLIGVFVYCYVNAWYMWALAVYLIAFFTDVLDGYLARKWQVISDAGKLLDPLADKLMLITALVCFWKEGWIPGAILWIVVAKEGLMIIGGIVLYRHHEVVYSFPIGKFATGCFTLGVLLTFFYEEVGPFNIIVLYISIGLGIAALIQYAYCNVIKPHFLNKKKDG